MDTYVFLREVLGSFGLVWMFVVFVTVVVWVLTGRNDSYRDAANAVFRNDDGPRDATDPRQDAPGRDSRKEARS
ncbi:CcoQ/FixQ family Cbb3-type cytochrome c oxidase assembly chaperone [Meridianimarinicoccus sp. RP-17]|uniref:CcoQ/FixQ family Cbb3-type cytochrome c oxidase assembly chaperone n=1 Tax=Meridianimarinicoccus zhengii TaxID=2056810 RepID=UPI0013A6A0BF|nr:CcoQ/FixQ family Cbb3-type cytochrome c oxidase assembly chaperone [Phycocomes zhengii]